MSKFYTTEPNLNVHPVTVGAKRPRKQRPAWIRKAIIPAAALFIGIGVGTAGGGDNQAPAAAPAVPKHH